MSQTKHPRWTRTLFSDDDLDAIAAAVHEAERNTSGEVRVHLERRVPRGADVLARARHVFKQLKMDATAERNGVLVYLAVEDRKLAIVGDEGVHARVGEAYWPRVRDAMVERLRAGAPRDAVVHAVTEIGLMLQKFFPGRPGDDNEISDEVSLGG